MRLSRTALPALLGATLLSAGCTSMVPRIPASGVVAGVPLSRDVDNVAARHYLQNHLARQRIEPVLGPHFDGLTAAGQRQTEGIPSTEQLAQLANHTSPDTAALVFAERIIRQPQNLAWSARLQFEVETLAADRKKQRHSFLRSQPYRIVFVPGWLYKSKPWTGADFASTRSYLAELGVESMLIETGENATVEANAQIVADTLRAARQSPHPILLVSGSKGGPEAAYALGHLMKPGETDHVRAWINICGALKGSPIADDYMRWPRTLIAKTIFTANGWGGLEGMESLTVARSHARAAQIHLPDDLFVVSYFGIPLSGDIRVFNHQFTYTRLRRYGPNDGLALLGDEIAPKGPVIPEVGRAHFLRDPDIHFRQAGLIQAVARALSRQPRSIAGSKVHTISDRKHP